MKFTLVFDGELRSNADFRRKWEIRSQLHPQLAELWQISPPLLTLQRTRYVPKNDHYQYLESHHSSDATELEPPPGWNSPDPANPNTMDLLAPIKRGDRNFLLLVRNSLALHCGLKITFLRKEPPGRVYQGGDLDNRIKTLFDALSVPNKDQVIADDKTIDDPIYCLVKDDGLISSIAVNTQTLLSSPNASHHQVHLLIEVDVRLYVTRLYNHCFLGG
jgi:hypothetical protein